MVVCLGGSVLDIVFGSGIVLNLEQLGICNHVPVLSILCF